MNIKSIPVLPLRDIVVFPGMVAPLFVGRKLSVNALNNVMKSNKRILLIAQKNSEIDDSSEPLSYRAMIIMMVGCIICIASFCKALGMSLWVILLFFIIYYAISTAVTRMRAELGSPVHDLHFIGPDEMMPKMFGTRLLGAQNLTMLAYFFFCNRAYRGHPMPHQLEGFKLAERTNINNLINVRRIDMIN